MPKALLDFMGYIFYCTDEICDTTYIIEKHRQEALLLHLGRLIMKTCIITLP